MTKYRIRQLARCVAGLGLDEHVIVDSLHVSVLASEIQDHGPKAIAAVDRWFDDMWLDFSSEVHHQVVVNRAEVAVLRQLEIEVEWPRRNNP